MEINEYVRPKTFEEAYEMLCNNKNSVILGGGAFLRLGKRKFNKVIDLSLFKLNYILEKDNKIKIGSMTTLREIENSSIIKDHYSGILSYAVSEIMGVQLRNQATIGGSVAGKYGFSDILTPLSIMETSVELYKNGIVSLEDFLSSCKYSKDIILSIIIEKESVKAKFNSLRLTSSDFSVINTAVGKTDNGKYKIAVGARPQKVEKAVEAMNYLENLDKAITVDIAREIGEITANSLKFQSNIRATADYRKSLTATFIKRAILEINSIEIGE